MHLQPLDTSYEERLRCFTGNGNFRSHSRLLTVVKSLQLWTLLWSSKEEPTGAECNSRHWPQIALTSPAPASWIKAELVESCYTHHVVWLPSMPFCRTCRAVYSYRSYTLTPPFAHPRDIPAGFLAWESIEYLLLYTTVKHKFKERLLYWWKGGVGKEAA